MTGIPRSSFLALLLFITPVGCNKPKPPPPNYLSLWATVEIDGKTYPVDFTWQEEGVATLDEGRGWAVDWKSTQHSFLRILDTKYVLVVWLPEALEKDLDQFKPTFALLEQANPQFLRSYPEVKTGESRDGVFRLAQLKIERAKVAFPEKSMTSDELSRKKDITSRKYGYLYGRRFEKDEWSQSNYLRHSLSQLKGVTPLGNRPEDIRKSPVIWSDFLDFNSGIAMTQNLGHEFGFALHDDTWVPLPYPGVYCYREGLKDDPAPIHISIGGQRVDQRQNELIFDEPNQQLIVVWRYGLHPLDK